MNDSYNFQRLYKQNSNIYSDEEAENINVPNKDTFNDNKTTSKSNNNNIDNYIPVKEGHPSKIKSLIISDQRKFRKSEIYKSELMNKQNYSRIKQSGRKSQNGIPLKGSDQKLKNVKKMSILEKGKIGSIKPSSRSKYLI